eukprot:gene4361-52094_t
MPRDVRGPLAPLDRRLCRPEGVRGVVPIPRLHSPHAPEGASGAVLLLDFASLGTTDGWTVMASTFVPPVVFAVTSAYIVLCDGGGGGGGGPTNHRR